MTEVRYRWEVWDTHLQELVLTLLTVIPVGSDFWRASPYLPTTTTVHKYALALGGRAKTTCTEQSSKYAEGKAIPKLSQTGVAVRNATCSIRRSWVLQQCAKMLISVQRTVPVVDRAQTQVSFIRPYTFSSQVGPQVPQANQKWVVDYFRRLMR